MITIETVVAVALKDPQAMDHLGQALRSDLVLANPFYRKVVEFADDFLLQYRKLPGDGDYEVWLETLEAGMARDGAKEALGRLLAVDTSSYDSTYFAEQAIEQLRKGAAQVARARLNELTAVEPETFETLAKKLEGVQAAGLRGLARLADVDTWAKPIRDEDLVPSGFPTLDRLIGGWGKELWMVFADTKVGKSMLLQNFASASALRGSRVLHITLELGIRPQIHRYYRQIARASRSDFVRNTDNVKQSLRHWMRLAKGEVYLLEFPAYQFDHEQLRRTIERASRTVGDVDLLVLDYVDLMIVAAGKRGKGGAYEDLGRLTHESRALCSEFDLTVLTASQAVRRPERKGKLTKRDMGDSYRKVQGVDGLLALMQTDEEEEVHQGRLGLLEVRDSGGRGTEISLYINRELSVIAELGHPNTVALMKRLGHLPAPPEQQEGLVSS